MSYSAKVIADSIADDVRLTTMEIVFPRFILAEFNTHRVLCLAGDNLLEFDLPAGTKSRYRRVYPMRLDEFVDKWLDGARRYGANPKRETDLGWIERPQDYYSAPVVAAHIGFANAGNINRLCREGALLAVRGDDGRTWSVQGRSIIEWRESEPAHTRFDMRAKLAGMRIRQLNEQTGDIQTSRVVDAFRSGIKTVFEVRAGEDFRVAGSADHRVLTADGWSTIGELRPGDFVVVRKFGKRDEDKRDPLRLKKIDGRWRSVWQRQQFDLLVSRDALCRRCERREAVCIHHVIPVYQDPSRAFDENNITVLCNECHTAQHETQGWQGGTYLYGSLAEVTDIVVRGEEQTYDLEISGLFPNFLVNGVVVHNSRNSASSRAIPVERRIAQVRDNPFVPEAFTKNQRGMQADAELDANAAGYARQSWLGACDHAIERAEQLVALGVHKQHANRVIEPYAWHTVVMTATELENFWALRISKNAQPEMFNTASLMREAFDASRPLRLDSSQGGHRSWHLPYVERVMDHDLVKRLIAEERGSFGIHPIDKGLVKLSVARCAAVSFERQTADRPLDDLLARHDMLLTSGHMSPFEHQALVRPSKSHDGDRFHYDPPFSPVWDAVDEGSATEAWALAGYFCGNFRAPFLQYRKMIPGERVYRGV